MSGETEREISAWTNDTVLVHLSKLIDANDLRYQQRYDAQQTALRDALSSQEKAVNAALIAAQQAVTKAEVAAEKRFDAVNEFRAQLADQAAGFMPRGEYQVMHDALIERVVKTENYMLQNMGQEQGRSAVVALIVSSIFAVTAVIAVVAAFVK